VTGGTEHDKDVHFIQMWVVPDTGALAPGYAQLDINEQLDSGDLVTVASGRPGHDAAIRIQQKQAALHAARPTAGSSINLPSAPFLHLYVAKGQVDVEGAGALTAGDAVRVTDADALRLTAATDAEVLVWEMHAALR
jgi:redox-sensitive bicupin YhaK (pirin superfamily)